MPENEYSKYVKNHIIQNIRERGHSIAKDNFYQCTIDDKFHAKILYSQRWNGDKTWYTGDTIRNFVNKFEENSFVLFAFEDANHVLIVPIKEVKKMIANSFKVYHIFERDGQYYTRPSQGGLNLTEYLNNYNLLI